MTTVLQNQQTPAASQRSAFAALHTAGLATGYTGISSLTSRTASAGGNRGRRNTNNQSNQEQTIVDSDDEDTDDEAGYELNPHDGFWNNNDAAELPLDEGSVNAHDDDNDSNMSPVVNPTPG